MEDPVWVSLMVWTTWILIAIIIDGLLIPIKLYLSRKSILKLDKKTVDIDLLPKMSVVIPAHNEEANIQQCIMSLIQCEYPNHKLELIVVDDGSTDNTINLVKRCQVDAILYGKDLKIIAKGHSGKVHTLNTGIKQSQGEIIVTIDADIKIASDALIKIARPFIEDSSVGAATGYIEIEWDNTKKDDFIKMFFSKSEFLEYLTSFNFERSYQSFVYSIYTMSGAFSAFKRNIIGNIGGYWPVTVSEDMHVTMMLHKKKVRIVNVPDAIAYADAITDYDTLYSQRVRWSRGQLEVAAMRKEEPRINQETLKDILGIVKDQKDPKLLELAFSYMKTKFTNYLKTLKKKTFRYYDLMGLPRILFIDHTIAFPRIIWVFILMMFPVLGLYTAILPIVALLMYLFYVFIDGVVILFAYYHSNPATKEKIEESFHYVLLLPIYRLVIFCFRLSAFLHVLNEPAGWKVEGPINGFKNGVKDARTDIRVSVATAIFHIGNIFNQLNLIKRRGK
ncbi:MAG: glycosyltransferase [Methanobacteriaceae archaeon]|nr:glycosyltransferase [Methanobacteriaceae archaeon]